MASFSCSVRNCDDVGVRGRRKKDSSPKATVKDPSCDEISSAVAVKFRGKGHRERNARVTH